MEAVASPTGSERSAETAHRSAGVADALFVRLVAREGRAADVAAFLRDGLAAVIGEPDTTSWYAVQFGPHDFAIFDTFPNAAGRTAHLSGKVGRALVERTPELFESAPTVEKARVLAFKLPDEAGQVDE